MTYEEALCLRVGDRVRFERSGNALYQRNPSHPKAAKLTIGKVYQVWKVETRLTPWGMPIYMYVENDKGLLRPYSYGGWSTLDPRNDIRDEVLLTRWFNEHPRMRIEKLTYRQAVIEQSRMRDRHENSARRWADEEAERVARIEAEQKEVRRQLYEKLREEFREEPEPLVLDLTIWARRLKLLKEI